MRTPKRLQVIYELAKQIDEEVKQVKPTNYEIIVDIHDELPYENSNFVLNMDNISRLEQNIPGVETEFLSKKLRVLLPSEYFCCGVILKLRHMYATLTLYTEDNVMKAHSYYAKCKKCKWVYYHGYKEDKETGTRIFNVDSNDTLIFNSGIAFTKTLLKRTNHIICIGGVSFEKTAEIYNASQNDDTRLNPDRLEAAWFIMRILEYVTTFKPWPRKDKSKELDLEELCKNIYAEVRKTVDGKWMNHVCDEAGCKERHIVIDGNEKLYRLICAADKTRIMGNTGEVNSYELCIRNPVHGNQYKGSSKFCLVHDNESSGVTDEQIDVRPITRSLAKQLIPSTISSGEGCKKDESIDRFHSRTAGMFYVSIVWHPFISLRDVHR